MSQRLFFLIGKDVNRPIGGVMQIYRFANRLAQLGLESIVIQGSEEFLPDWFDIYPVFKRLSLSQYKNTAFSKTSDYLVIPETFIPHYFALPDVKKIIFNQNAGYTFGERLDISPDHVQSVYSDPLLSHVICVSLSDYSFLNTCLNVPSRLLFRLNNPIDTDLFKPKFPKLPLISYMPRKNPAHSRIVLSMIQSLDSFKSGGWSIRAIDKCSLESVALSMQESFLFLSFGFPEGFGLPLAESLASGCRLIGYDGVGGQEIFSLASALDCAKSIPVFDFYSYLTSVDSYIKLYNCNSRIPAFYESSSQIADNIRSNYSFDSFSRSCQYFLGALAS